MADPVSIHNNRAFVGLSEDFFKIINRCSGRFDHVGKHVAGTHGRKLENVTDQYQHRSHGNCLYQMKHQQGIYH